MDFSKLTYTEPPIYVGPQVRVYHGVYEAQDVAVKVISATTKEEVENEFQAQRSLQHPGICAALALGWKEQEAWMLLEWLQGDLAQEITRRRNTQQPWTPDELWQHFVFLLEVFSYAQQQGISHRDIKPQNIFIAPDGSLKVGDFGTAKYVGMKDTETLKGSPYFMSPELKQKFHQALSFQSSNGSYNAYRSDVYSLGLTFLHMLLLVSSPELLVQANLQASTDQLIAKLPSDFQPLFALMLRERDRMDFLELRAWMQQSLYVPPPQPFSCRYCLYVTQKLVQDWTGAYCSEECLQCWHRYYQQGIPALLKIVLHDQATPP